ncbi:M60 family metallopeptidase [Serratia sp. AKBS12]|uniref:M60 family metallopeptidase n=1 Tax=Serratia sp. AKBS12 TaxID=2974597 RepID=UPI0021656858|nr:M60 family metallopeptidase [Serratia sp. AKBS12]MCS3409311.1 M60 family metallopeptidase [Serratia sp. AKBS12]
MMSSNKLIQRGLPFDIAKRDHRRWFSPHPTQSTGLWCEAGDSLEIVCHYNGDMPSSAPELWIYPVTESADEESKSRQSVQLDFGTQRITAKNRGIIYFAAPNFPLDSEIYAQVVSGARQMPRFVLGLDTQQTWNQALEDFSCAPYGELVGQRMIVAMPLCVLKENIDNPQKVSELWDKIVSLAEECYGLHANYPRPHQATPFQYIFETKPSSTGGYMSASNAWLGTNLNGAYCVCNSRDLTEDGWGPWHELGHHYQLDDVRWDGLGEVTVNIVSLYVQSALNGRATRLDSIWPELFEYFKEHDKDYSRLGLFHQVAMFWQLTLAFGRDFHARLGQRYRILKATERPRNSNEKIQRFILECSRVSGFNLLTFFEQWGLPVLPETVQEINNMELLDLTKPIWKNTDEKPAYQFSLQEQNITGQINIPEHIHENGIFDVSVIVTNKNNNTLSYQWEIPEGFSFLSSPEHQSVTISVPPDVIHNSSALIRVFVRNSDGRAMTLGGKLHLKVTGEREIHSGEYIDIAIMRKYNTDKLHSWSDSRQGKVGDIYLGVWSDGSREYFRLKKTPYWYFPTDHKDNSWWEFLFKYTDQYFLDNTHHADIVIKNNHLYEFLFAPISQQLFLEKIGALSISGGEITTNLNEELFHAAGRYIVEVYNRNDIQSKARVILEILETSIVLQNTRVVGAAGYPMSNEMFLQRTGATTLDGSSITLTPEPADCIHKGHYLIVLKAGKNNQYTCNVIYDVISLIPPHRTHRLWGQDSDETWCGTKD